MNIKEFLQRICAAAAVLAAMFAGAQGGHESQNGGSWTRAVSLNGKDYSFADLHFQPLPFNNFEFDRELRDEIGKILFFLSDSLDLPMVSLTGQEFLKDFVLNDYVEYRFVAKLPEGCRFIPTENLPPDLGKTLNAGCTQGSITFILPDEFVGRSLTLKSLFVIHERLHDLASRESLDVKTDFIKALYYLETKFRPALLALPGSAKNFAFTDEELEVLNVLSRRVRQLTGRRSYSQRLGNVAFTREGGLLLQKNSPGIDRPAWQIKGEHLVIQLGSALITTPTPELEKRFRDTDIWPVSVIEGNNFRVVDSQVRARGHIEINGYNSILENARILRASTGDSNLRISIENTHAHKMKLELGAEVAAVQFGSGDRPPVTPQKIALGLLLNDRDPADFDVDGANFNYRWRSHSTVVQIQETKDLDQYFTPEMDHFREYLRPREAIYTTPLYRKDP